MNKLLSSVAILAIVGNVVMAGGDIAPVEPVVPEVVVEESWKFGAGLYVHFAGIEGETAGGAPIDMSFSDILDDLDMTFMGTFLAQKENWTLGLDAIYLKIGDKPNTPLPGPATLTNIQLKSWIYTPFVAYRMMESEKFDLSILAGARYLKMEPYVEITPLAPIPPISGSDSGSVTDGIIGIRGEYEINQKWYMPFQFDVGGGDSDSTWQAFAAVGYKFENWDLIAGYRYMEWEFESDEPLKDLSMSGPIVGAMFRF
jgi:hypothetical protein